MLTLFVLIAPEFVANRGLENRLVAETQSQKCPRLYESPRRVDFVPEIDFVNVNAKRLREIRRFRIWQRLSSRHLVQNLVYLRIRDFEDGDCVLPAIGMAYGVTGPDPG